MATGVWCRFRSVSCMMLVVVLSNALPQPISHSPLSAASDAEVSVKRIQSRLVSLEDRISRREMVVSTVNNPLIKGKCRRD